MIDFNLKKLFALMLSGVLTVSLLASCNSAPAEDEPMGDSTSTAETPATEDGSGDETTLVYWGWNPDSIVPTFDKYKESTGATVALEYVTIQQTEAFQKLQTTVTSGLELPDLILSEVNQRGTMMELDIWEDMSADPYNFDFSIVLDHFGPICYNSSGALVALPIDAPGAGLAYKKDLALEYFGTDDPDELEEMLTSWDDIISLGNDVQSQSDGEAYMFASLSDIQTIEYSRLTEAIVNDNTLNADAAKSIINLIVSVRDNNTSDNIGGTSPAYGASYAEENHIFYPAATWSPQYVIAPNDPEGLDSWAMMEPPGGCFLWGGSAHMIPKDAENKVEGFNFAAWIAGDEGSVWQKEEFGYFYAAKAPYEDPTFASLTNPHFGDQDIGQLLFVDAFDTMQAARPVSIYDVAINDAWTLVIEAINSDDSLTADAAFEMFSTELQNKIPDLQV